MIYRRYVHNSTYDILGASVTSGTNLPVILPASRAVTKAVAGKEPLHLAYQKLSDGMLPKRRERCNQFRQTAEVGMLS